MSASREERDPGVADLLWIGWIAGLVFITPIPGTIALRNLWLAIGLALLAWRGRTSLPGLPISLRPAAWAFAALSLWLLVHSAFLAEQQGAAFDQLRANWLNQFVIGGLAAWAAMQIGRRGALQAVVAGLATHLLWLLGWQLFLRLGADAWPFKATPFGAYDYHGTLNSFLLALLVADRAVWVLRSASPLGVDGGRGWALLALSLAADIALSSRNSTLVDMVLLLAAGLVITVSSRKLRWAGGLSLAVVILTTASVRFDERWWLFAESVTISWTSDSSYWRTLDQTTRPRTASGNVVEESAYLRIAWARQAIEAIAAHPLGIGFGHEAFGRAVAMRHGHPGMGSSHSGWLDFAIGTGLPGLLLLLVFGFAAVRGGWRQCAELHDDRGWLLSFFVGGYWLRIALDGHFSGWRLALFACIAGVLVASLKRSEA